MARAHGSPKKRSKAYRPRAGSLYDANVAALSRRLRQGDSSMIFGAGVSQEQMQLLHTRFWQALEDIKRGNKAEYAWSSLGSMLNMTQSLCELGVGREYLADAALALDAFNRARARGDATGSYLLDGPGIAAITEALHIHDEQTKHATHDDILRAERVVAERLAMGVTYEFH